MKATSLFMLVGIMVSGCTPGYRIIKEAELHNIDVQLQEQNQHLDSIQQIMMADCEAVRVQLEEIASRHDEQARQQRKLSEAVRGIQLEQQKAAEEKQLESRRELPVTEAGEKQVIGAVEKVFLSPPGAILTARIDTGAVTSSLDARDIKLFERNGDRWVRFAVVNPEDESEIFLELELVRKVRIIQAEQAEPEKRPVVELGVTVGKHTQTAQFTLTDRRHMEFPMLIGRNILKDIMVVDVSQANIAPPRPPANPSEDSDTQ